MNNRKIDTKKFITSVALCAPAVRLVVVHAYVYIDDDGKEDVDVEFAPVVAIRASMFKEFMRWARPEESDAESIEGAIKDGFRLTKEGVEHESLVMTEEFGIWTAAESFEGRHHEYEEAACQWRPEEDEARLAHVADKLKARLSATLRADAKQLVS